jgi:cytochrome c biogenesis protein CcmG, thiol:disulfide interchange protein DsbE
MKKLILAFVLAIFSITTYAKAEVGQLAPLIEGKLMNGQDFSSSSYKGKVLIIHFWASWCEPCQEEMPFMESFYQKYRKDGLEIITISMDKSSDIDSAKHISHHFSFLSTHKDQVNLKGYGRIWRIPSTFIINRQGILIKDGLTGTPQVDDEVLNKIILPALKN